MASWSDVRAVAEKLPEVVEDRDAPTAEVMAAFVPDLGAKEALIADEPGVYFTTPHFEDHPSVLVRLERIGVRELTELLVEAWLARAPKRLGAQHRDSLP